MKGDIADDPYAHSTSTARQIGDRDVLDLKRLEARPLRARRNGCVLRLGLGFCKQLFRKLDCKRRAEAIRAAKALGWL